MTYIAREQIGKIFNNPQRAMQEGLWLSGYEGEGEFKVWYENGQLYILSFYENGLEEGEYKEWHDNGEFAVHCFLKNGKRDGELKTWNESGELSGHIIYKNDRVIKYLL